MDEMDEVVKEFLVESYDNLDQLDQDFVTLEEAESSDPEILGSIFRTIHTIKGTCGFLGFSKLEGITHVGENLLSKLRTGELDVDADITSALLHMVDAVREILGNVESVSEEGDTDYSNLMQELTRLQTPSTTKAPSPGGESKGDVASKEAAGEGANGGFSPEVAPLPSPKQVKKIQKPKESGAKKSKSSDGRGNKREAGKSLASSTIRVDVNLLDSLMNLVGELVLARNRILQVSEDGDPSSLGAATQRLNLITSELQEGVMKTRMQPIDSVWNRFPRVVRDLSLDCGKQIRLEMHGRETELDKTLLEAIKDPLTHIVRNSVDHGIESPEKRVAQGKNPEGTMELHAFHDGGQVNIEIRDDGGGICPVRVGAKAVERGLVTPEVLKEMPDRDVVRFIFAPGFSTAETVTNISGRGVGMDVVRTNIEKIGGSIDLSSKVGEGTTIRIRIPLTLAIVPALLVSCRNGRYAIPQTSLVEVVRLDGKSGAVEYIHSSPVYRLRGMLLPLVFLDHILKGSSQSERDHELDGCVNIIVLQSDELRFGLVVDEIHDTGEIVVKPLAKQLNHIDCFSGATIMGDGRVALILDVPGVAQRGGVYSQRTRRALEEGQISEGQSTHKIQTLLVFRVGTDGRMAIPLDSVTRLEEFPIDSIEWAGSQKVVQYRGDILPLVPIPELLPQGGGSWEQVAYDDEPQTKCPVVVYREGPMVVGLVVDQILDIVAVPMALHNSGIRPGVLGTMVIAERITEVLDLSALVEGFCAAFLPYGLENQGAPYDEYEQSASVL